MESEDMTGGSGLGGSRPPIPSKPPPPPPTAGNGKKGKKGKGGNGGAGSGAGVGAGGVGQAEALKNEGNALLAAGKLEASVEAYTAAIALNGTSAIFYSNRSSAYIKQESYRLAIADADKAIAIDPDYVKVGVAGRVGGLVGREGVGLDV
jgi:hypothetical protein